MTVLRKRGWSSIWASSSFWPSTLQVSPDRDLAVSLDHLVSDEVVSVDLDRRTRREPFNGTEERELRGKD